MILLAILLSSIVPADCDEPQWQPGWQEGAEWRTALPPAKSVHWQVVPVEHMNAVCQTARRGYQVHACAQWGPEVCVIWAQEPEASSPKWLRCHERRHCAGWVHGR